MADSKFFELQILKILCGFESYNQNNIAKLIGLDPDKSTPRVQVSRVLKKLNKQGYLEQVRLEIDELGKKWAMKRDIETIEGISKEYPEIIPTMQQNEIIISLIVDKLYFFTEEPGPVSDLKGIVETENREKIKTMLKLSTTFLKIFLQQSTDDLKLAAMDIFWLSDRGQSLKYRNEFINKNGITTIMSPQKITLSNNPFGNLLFFVVDIIFQSCVNTDILNGLKNKDVYEYMETLSQETGWFFAETRSGLEDLMKKK